ncbi:MAG: LysM peptidoglycan-binding domain-containing protein [Chitinophagaceae bacterium]|nr:LysM peptidoglycan-binding domain-containing protein [Chitinophagaceae bacterium]
MKKLFFILLMTPLLSSAQKKILLAAGVSPNLYINHTVEAKENYYSIGRMYNVSPKDIAPFNKLSLDGGLNLGQALKIPLTASNFFQSGKAAADEIFVPVYYEVKEKEGLYRVALNHHNLPLETLKKWNNINGDVVKSGVKLVVGYLKVNKELSALAASGIGSTISENLVVKAVEKDVTEDKSNKKLPARDAGPPVVNNGTVPPVVIKPEAEKKVVVKEDNQTVPTEIKKTTVIGKAKVGGTFEDIYKSQAGNAELPEQEGIAGVFKSTSGWDDKKYYCLHNSATPGMVIKITNPANGKSVFAKVLDVMPDVKQNEGLLILISNAAAGELAAEEAKFNCIIQYSK